MSPRHHFRRRRQVCLYALISVDDILAVAFGNCADGALLSTGAAADTGAGNDVSHSSYLHTMMSFFVLKRIYILAWIPENAIPFFPQYSFRMLSG